MCASTNRMKMTPLAAISIFRAIVDRAARAPVTSVGPMSGRPVLVGGVVVASTTNATVPAPSPTSAGSVRYPARRTRSGRVGAAPERPGVVVEQQLVDRGVPVSRERELAGPPTEQAAVVVRGQRGHGIAESVPLL